MKKSGRKAVLKNGNSKDFVDFITEDKLDKLGFWNLHNGNYFAFVTRGAVVKDCILAYRILDVNDMPLVGWMFSGLNKTDYIESYNDLKVRFMLSEKV